MKKSPVKIASVISILALLVAVFTMFAPAFDEDVAAARGSYFDVMWGMGLNGHNVLVIPTIGFCIILLAIVLAGFGLTIDDSKTVSKKLYGGVLAVLSIVGGIICLLAITLFIAGNDNVFWGTNDTLGAGTIVPAVFCFLAALPGVYLLLKRNEAK